MWRKAGSSAGCHTVGVGVACLPWLVGMVAGLWCGLACPLPQAEAALLWPAGHGVEHAWSTTEVNRYCRSGTVVALCAQALEHRVFCYSVQSSPKLSPSQPTHRVKREERPCRLMSPCRADARLASGSLPVQDSRPHSMAVLRGASRLRGAAG